MVRAGVLASGESRILLHSSRSRDRWGRFSVLPRTKCADPAIRATRKGLRNSLDILAIRGKKRKKNDREKGAGTMKPTRK